MADPVTTPVTEPVATPTVATPTPEPSNYFGSDGTLNDGWQTTLPDGYKDEASLKTVKDTKVLAKMFVDTKRMVGKNTIAIPSDTSTEEEWAEYYKAGGRPETIEDYNLKPPEGLDEDISKTIFPEGRLAKWQERFYKNGISKKAADQLIADFTQDILSDIQARAQAEEQKMTELVSALNNEYGAAYTQKLHFGDIAVEEGTHGDPEFKERLAPLRKNPDFIRLIVNLGEKFSEGKSPNFANIPTPSDLQTQINELMANPILTNPQSTVAQRKVIMDKIMDIRKKMPAKTT